MHGILLSRRVRMRSQGGTRRWVLRAVLYPLVAALLGIYAPSAAALERTETRLLMGTAVEVRVEDVTEAQARVGIAAAYDEMARLAQMMSHYDDQSVVSAINRQAGRRPVPVPPELMQVLQMAQALARRSGGAFDITIGALRVWRFDRTPPRLPSAAAIAAARARVDYRRLRLDTAQATAFLPEAGMRLDLGGIAKLYILQAGMQRLQHHGIARALINGGGDIVASGGETRPWRIGIRHARASGLAGVVQIARGFVVSSGDYERFFIVAGRRYHHILDPRTGYPATGVQHVTVIGQSLEAVNGVSAAAMVLGPHAGRQLIEQTPGLAGYMVTAAGVPWASKGFVLRAH